MFCTLRMHTIRSRKSNHKGDAHKPANFPTQTPQLLEENPECGALHDLPSRAAPPWKTLCQGGRKIAVTSNQNSTSRKKRWARYIHCAWMECSSSCATEEGGPTPRSHHKDTFISVRRRAAHPYSYCNPQTSTGQRTCSGDFSEPPATIPVTQKRIQCPDLDA